MPKIDFQRPPKLYRYSQRAWLERALLLGEFRLRPAADLPGGGEQILPFGPTPSSQATYLTLSMAKAWDESLFDTFAGSDSCLVIHDAEAFGERIHRAAEKTLPNWAGIDAAISYGVPSALGAAFSKHKQFARQQEWLFAWRPVQPGMSLNPVMIQIGNIEGIAELRGKSV